MPPGILVQAIPSQPHSGSPAHAAQRQQQDRRGSIRIDASRISRFHGSVDQGGRRAFRCHGHDFGCTAFIVVTSQSRARSGNRFAGGVGQRRLDSERLSEYRARVPAIVAPIAADLDDTYKQYKAALVQSVVDLNAAILRQGNVPSDTKRRAAQGLPVFELPQLQSLSKDVDKYVGNRRSAAQVYLLAVERAITRYQQLPGDNSRIVNRLKIEQNAIDHIQMLGRWSESFQKMRQISAAARYGQSILTD